MLVDPVMPYYTKPSVIPDVPIYQQIGHSGLIALWITFVIMFLSALAFISMAWRVPVEKRLFHVLTTLIVALSAISYFGMATGGGASFVGPITSKCHKHSNPVYHRDIFRQVFWARYVDWALTTPLLFLNLAFLAGLNGADILVTVVANVAMIFMGLFSAFGESKGQRWGYYIFAWLAYLVVLYQLAVGGRRKAANKGTGASRLFNAISGFILLIWTIYPIVWALGPGSRKLSVDSEIIWYAVLDFLAKPVFGFWLLSTHARSSTAPSIDGFWSHGLGSEGTLRLDNDENP